MPTARELEAALAGQASGQWTSTPMAPTQTEKR
jgi:hypothetical protein